MQPKKEFIELIKYGFWGGISTAINLILFAAFIKFGMHYVVSNVVSFFIAVCFSYYFNDKFVFKGGADSHAKKGVKFFAMRGVSIVIDSGLLVFFHEICGLHEYLAKLIVSVLIIGTTFIVSKLFVFK